MSDATIDTATVDGVTLTTGDAFDVHGELELFAVMRAMYRGYIERGFRGWGFVWSPMSGAGAWLRQIDGELDAIGFAGMSRAAGARICFPLDVPAESIVTMIALPPLSATASRPYFEALGLGNELPPAVVAQ